MNIHVVNRGETLYSIARLYGVNPDIYEGHDYKFGNKMPTLLWRCFTKWCYTFGHTEETPDCI